MEVGHFSSHANITYREIASNDSIRSHITYGSGLWIDSDVEAND